MHEKDSVGQARENTSTAFSLQPYGDEGCPLPELQTLDTTHKESTHWLLLGRMTLFEKLHEPKEMVRDSGGKLRCLQSHCHVSFKSSRI